MSACPGRFTCAIDVRHHAGLRGGRVIGFFGSTMLGVLLFAAMIAPTILVVIALSYCLNDWDALWWRVVIGVTLGLLLGPELEQAPGWQGAVFNFLVVAIYPAVGLLVLALPAIISRRVAVSMQ